jgi:hypothetical protein
MESSLAAASPIAQGGSTRRKRRLAALRFTEFNISHPAPTPNSMMLNTRSIRLLTQPSNHSSGAYSVCMNVMGMPRIVQYM